MTQAESEAETAHIASRILSNYDAFVLDLDGVLWRGQTVLPGAPEAVARLRALGKRIFFVSNNSTLSRDDFVAKFRSMGFEARREEVVCTAFAAAAYVAGLFAFSRFASMSPGSRSASGEAPRAFVLGEAGIGAELDERGIPWLSLDAHGPEALEAARVAAVVVGLDRRLSYDKLAAAMRFLGDKECAFVATNEDASFPVEGGRLTPGAGAVVAAVSVCTGRAPVVVGKPRPFMRELIKRVGADTPPHRTLMVGDRLDTDVAFGAAAGWGTLLVCTGVHGPHHVGEAGREARPGAVLPALAALALGAPSPALRDPDPEPPREEPSPAPA